jgi:hypothetical protein
MLGVPHDKTPVASGVHNGGYARQPTQGDTREEMLAGYSLHAVVCEEMCMRAGRTSWGHAPGIIPACSCVRGNALEELAAG